MYLHLGQDVVVRTRDIVGIFDLDTTTLSKDTRSLLAAAEKSGQVVNVSDELPKSFVITKNKATRLYVSQLNAPTLKKRLENRA